jgi:hypothetical protein
METTERRILACLIGIATGDAVGKQTESSPATRCCAGIQMACTDSRDLPGRQSRDTVTTRSVHGSSGKRRTTLSERWQSRGRLFGTVTCRTRASDASCSCAENACIRAFRHCGSSTRPPILREWPSATMAAERAVRVAPVGLRYRPDRLDDIVAAAREASIPTHGGPLAIAAAAATAAAVSAAVEALSAEEIIDFARRAAATAERERTDPPATRFAEALGGIVRELRGWQDRHAGAIGARYFPNDPLTIVPAGARPRDHHELRSSGDSAGGEHWRGQRLGGVDCGRRRRSDQPRLRTVGHCGGRRQRPRPCLDGRGADYPAALSAVPNG